MNLFAFAAAMMAVIHLVAGWQRPRLAVIVSGILWLLYAVYEPLAATGSVRWGLQHSRRSCVALSHIGARNLLRLPIVHGATKPVEGRRHSSRRNRPGCFRAGGGGLWLRRSGERRAGGCSGDRRRLCDQIEVQDQSDITPTVKSGIAPANFAMTDWESFDVRFGARLCENSNARHARRNILEKLRVMRTDNAADTWLDAMLENCIFYILPMYEFSHSLGHSRPGRASSRSSQVRYAPKAEAKSEYGFCRDGRPD